MKILTSTVLIFSTIGSMASSDIVLSKKIKPLLRTKIERDLNLINSYKFSNKVNAETLSVMGLASLNAETATEWLNKRVNYIIEEKAFSVYNLLFKRVVFTEKKNVIYPEANILPYSMDQNMIQNFDDQNIDHQDSIDNVNAEKGFTVMSNIGSALYLSGKQKSEIYGLKVSRGFLKPMIKVEVNSPRAGIIQIGEGLFAPELAIDPNNEDALANSIFRLGTFFHEARHSDGHGKSLGFTHTTCPEGHDYAGLPACDENLNGPYTVGRLMITEMARACNETSCTEADKESLRILIIDNASRVLKQTHKGEASTIWDDTPESVD